MNLIERVILPLCSSIVRSIPFFNIVLCIDRIYAIFFPLTYRLTNKNRNILISFLIVTFTSLSISIYDVFVYNISYSPELKSYVAIRNTYTAKVGRVFFPITTLLHVIIIITVVLSNVIISSRVRKYRKKKTLMFKRLDQNTNGNQDNEFTLTVMQLIQGTVFFVGQMPLLIIMVIDIFNPFWWSQYWHERYLAGAFV